MIETGPAPLYAAAVVYGTVAAVLAKLVELEREKREVGGE